MRLAQLSQIAMVPTVSVSLSVGNRKPSSVLDSRHFHNQRPRTHKVDRLVEGKDGCMSPNKPEQTRQEGTNLAGRFIAPSDQSVKGILEVK